MIRIVCCGASGGDINLGSEDIIKGGGGDIFSAFDGTIWV